jgi:leucyl-tRNA synthetase
MQGFNVLFPFAFHCTGTPIVAAARRIREGEKEQIRMLLDMGIEKDDIPKFKDTLYWVEHFTKSAEEDLKSLGLAIDWRRKFITTSLNPYYDKFIKWQFRKLRSKNYVIRGRHPVIWCTKCNSPVGDHDRLKGEGEVPTEFTLIKFRIKDEYLVAATLRPETIYGLTNVWLDPDVKYVRARVNDEIWLVSSECAEKLMLQNFNVAKLSEIKGSELIGKYCESPIINRQLIILPSKFCNPKKGTGIVGSVPSDAPDDWMGLVDLKKDYELSKKYNLDLNLIKSIEPIPIIRTGELGELPAVKICDQYGVKNQLDREKLEKAKEEIYKRGFYIGVMGGNCAEYEGYSVTDARREIKDTLIQTGGGAVFYEPSGEVVCRCLTDSVVKIVTDQWFIAYSNQDWKAKASSSLSDMYFYPADVKKQIEYVINWLSDWACTREIGLGTNFPDDEKWLIESLSDSTIYMAYYTISKYLDGERIIAPELIDDAFFDYIFYGTGDVEALAHKYRISADILQQMRAEFLYWYPFDIRCSGKDLVQNHLTFCIFNHIAIFDKKYIPKGFGVNGWILIDGEKMSKSLGNELTLRDCIARYGADATRFTLAWAGEGLDDASFDTEFAEYAPKRLSNWFEHIKKIYGKGRTDWKPIDSWLESQLHRLTAKSAENMEVLNFRTALKIAFFDMQSVFRWYLRRCANDGNVEVVKKFIETQIKLLAPFIPHLCEELWETIGKKEFVSVQKYPNADEFKLNLSVEGAEQFLKNTISDIHEILKVTKKTPARIILYTAYAWKELVYRRLINECKSAEKRDVKEILTELCKKPELKQFLPELADFTKKCYADLKRLKEDELATHCAAFDEYLYLQDALPFLRTEFGCKVEVYQAEKAPYDPKGKAKVAVPRKVGIYVE